MRPDVSVCIATFRRPRGLARLLRSLARQKLPAGVSLEILVVDNDPAGSAGQAPEVDAGHPTQWLHEPRRNIALARNRAVDTARGEWLAFVDDDEEADEHWIAAHWARVHAAQLDGAFGPVLPRLEREAGSWLAPEEFYARPRHRSGTPVAAGDARTGNAFVRRAALLDQCFDPAFGRSGGSDTELFGRLLARGARFAWCDEARVCEWIPPERHGPRWLARRSLRGGIVSTRLALRRGAAGRARLALRALAGFALCLAGLAPAACAGGRPGALRVGLRLCVQLGHLAALLGLGFEEYGETAAETAGETAGGAGGA